MILKVYIQPNSKKNEIAGRYGNAIKIRLKARPIEGRANEMLIEFLAKEYNVPKSRIQIIKGHTSRQKLIAIK